MNQQSNSLDLKSNPFAKGVKVCKVIPNTPSVMVKDAELDTTYILNIQSVKNCVEFSTLSHKFRTIVDKLSSQEPIILDFDKGKCYAIDRKTITAEQAFFNDEMSMQAIQETYDDWMNSSNPVQIGKDVREKFGLSSKIESKHSNSGVKEL